MRTIVNILSALAAAMFAAVTHARTEVTSLPCAVGPLGGDLLSLTEWDFSVRDAIGSGPGCTYSNHGDTLLTEKIGGRRYWYATAPASMRFVGEEDRLFKLWCADSTLQCFSAQGAFVTEYYSASAYGTAAGALHNVYANVRDSFTKGKEEGLLVLHNGDTIRGVSLTRENRIVELTVADTKSPPAAYAFEIFRWHKRGEVLPAAMQIRLTAVGTSAGVDSAPLLSCAFLPTVSDNGHPKPKIGADGEARGYDWLKDVSLRVSQGELTVAFATSLEGIQGEIDLTDTAGHTFGHKDFVTNGANQEMAIPTPSCRAGSYIVAVRINVQPPVVEKMIAVIH